VHDVYLHDHPASLETWRAMFNLARQGRLAAQDLSETRARIGIAEQLDDLFETDLSIEQLRMVVDAKPPAPYGATARAALRLGICEDRMGQRAAAIAAYQAAIAAAPADDPDGVRGAARERLRRAPDPKAAEAYRLSIEGWRALQRGELARAEEALTRSAALAPADPVTAYRVARLRVAQHRTGDALESLERLLASRPVAPPAILGAACLDAARLHEQAGDRSEAVELYLRASRVRGADAQTRRAAAQSLTRLRAPGGSR
jgi:tetratricopeptide (TPR) repeat protein